MQLCRPEEDQYLIGLIGNWLHFRNIEKLYIRPLSRVKLQNYYNLLECRVLCYANSRKVKTTKEQSLVGRFAAVSIYCDWQTDKSRPNFVIFHTEVESWKLTDRTKLTFQTCRSFPNFNVTSVRLILFIFQNLAASPLETHRPSFSMLIWVLA